ncbi:MAG: hypothetical protein HY906_28180 [Deltaproteobacteria bacterium]|nr:hypothetical protein [Deltaproteobacteria bacterium]
MCSRNLAALGAAAPLAVAATARACSGEGAMDVIRANERLGWLLFGVSLLVVALGAALLRRMGVARCHLAWLAALLLAHPGWWMSARRGDCGYTLRELSIAMTAVSAAIVVGVVIVTLARRRLT